MTVVWHQAEPAREKSRPEIGSWLGLQVFEAFLEGVEFLHGLLEGHFEIGDAVVDDDGFALGLDALGRVFIDEAVPEGAAAFVPVAGGLEAMTSL